MVESAEDTDDPVRNTVEDLTSFCAPLYGRSSAKRRTEMVLPAVGAESCWAVADHGEVLAVGALVGAERVVAGCGRP